MAIIKLTTTDKKFSPSTKNFLPIRIPGIAILAAGGDDMFALAGLDKPNIGLLSDEFLQEVQDKKFSERRKAVLL